MQISLVRGSVLRFDYLKDASGELILYILFEISISGLRSGIPFYSLITARIGNTAKISFDLSADISRKKDEAQKIYTRLFDGSVYPEQCREIIEEINAEPEHLCLT